MALRCMLCQWTDLARSKHLH
ncbi:hypothetical protein TSAR_001709 [Trichomalopsis sarcophagae]|uniref:Uncharacterized protein n=1 Tax=Trichomalopsis sarcophagae TaxID=543379 RepID=A0A232F7F3_9HYME|nr:hypothetical protein TSAR_001709 [Trichomalopsis sarcophagae]